MARNWNVSAIVVFIGASALSGVAFGDELKTDTKSAQKVASTETVATYDSASAASQSLSPAIDGGVSVGHTPGMSLSGIADHIALGGYTTFHGSPLHDLGSQYGVDRHGNNVANNYNALYFDTDMTLAYRVTKDIAIGADIPFLGEVSRGQGFVLGDLGLKIYNHRLFSNQGVTIGSDLILQGATSTASQARNLKMGVKTTPFIRYSIPHSNFTIGAWNEIKDYLGVSYDKTFKLWTLPYAAYALSDQVALNVGYEMEWHHNVGQKGFGFDTYQTDLQPGVIFSVAKGVIVNPYLQYFTDQKLDFQHAGFGAFISANIL
jgi:hypothetical protein